MGHTAAGGRGDSSRLHGGCHSWCALRGVGEGAGGPQVVQDREPGTAQSLVWGREPSPTRPCPTPRPVNVSPPIAKGLCRCDEVKDLEMGGGPGLSEWPHVIRGSLGEGSRTLGVREGLEHGALLALTTEGGATSQGCRRRGFSQQSSGGNWPCTLGCSPLRPISGLTSRSAK